MAMRLGQLPLPWLPEGAIEIVPGIGVVLDGDGGGTAWVHGMATYAWGAGDWACRKLAAVQLAELTGAGKKDIAAAFGTDAATFWRWRQADADPVLAGLLPGKRGPKGPSKLTPHVTARIRELAAGGLPQAEIGRQCGVSEFAVRSALGRVGIRKAAGHPDGVGEAGASSAPAQDMLPGETEVLPVLPDPVPRAGERALARFGLLGEGAVPVFTPGAKIPLAGLLLVLPALAGTGLLDAARAVYGRLRNGFYGLETVLVLLVFLALLREPRAEGATRVPPAALGRVLGLDRAPEVKTIRRKLAELAAAGKAAEPTPVNLGSSTDQAVLELFGTGIRGAGGASNVTVTVGNTQGTVQYAGAQGGGAAGSYYGLDQVNVLLPRSLLGSGTVNVVLTASGQTANTVTVDIQ